ncbi:nuclease harbi1 [Plakobranchus ocellatus]|uniref:Nuclease harbi1 n=1 Tax=Plakobranchus ocellatus TaxID=259542 RepID=A0AAV4BHQ8_9GAST|nr:nuclease harbi1 [Plakobranchus ocellatus]
MDLAAATVLAKTRCRTELWAKTPDGIFSKWDFPNCIGSIDGKHIPLSKPPNFGSLYYNYKDFFSIVLLAVADAYGRLLVVDIGSYGGIFNANCLGKHLCEGSLDFPAAKKIPGTELITPHVFVADEAFALLPNLMKPFARRQLTTQNRVFNYRQTSPPERTDVLRQRGKGRGCRYRSLEARHHADGATVLHNMF